MHPCLPPLHRYCPQTTTTNVFRSTLTKNKIFMSRAVVVGIDEYCCPHIPNLHHCVADATRLAKELAALKFEVTLLLSTNGECTQQRILSAINSMRKAEAHDHQEILRENPKSKRRYA